jgi:hypothetical protein
MERGAPKTIDETTRTRIRAIAGCDPGAGERQKVDHPASTGRATPVMFCAAGEARNVTAPETASDGIHPTGRSDRSVSKNDGWFSIDFSTVGHS